MTMTDPIADFLTRIRNALMATHERPDIPASKLKLRLAEILKEEGYITDVQVLGEPPQKMIRVTLKYDASEASVIRRLERVSKPGRRLYVTADRIPKVLNGLGIAIISTSGGIMTDRECHRQNIGGELLCQVW